jgi:prevent-host-death family protein
MALTFRNSQGDLVDIPSVAATKVKNEFGAVLDRAVAGGAVAITRHDTTKAVLLSFVEFAALVKARSADLDDLHGEFDALLARMQTPAAKKGAAAAFSAAPGVLGRAAVAAAEKPRPATRAGARRRSR